MKVNSDLGRELLAQSRLLDESSVDVSVLSDFSIKFQSCQPVTQWVADDSNYNGFSSVQQKYLARFTLCPTDKCTNKGCSSSETGEYVVDLTTYTKTLLKAAGYSSNKDENNSNQGNGNNVNYYDDDGNAEENDDGGSFDFSPLDYLGCDYYNNGGGSTNVTFSGYISAYCVNHQAIKFGVFSDSVCGTSMSGGVSGFHNGEGYDLPYSSEALVSSSDDCTSCEASGNQGGSIATTCETLYTYSGKCETNLMAMEYPNESACEYISAMSGIRGNKSTFSGAKAQTSIVASISIQVMSGATICLATYVWFLSKKFTRAKNNLRH
jgi:hypothetical protein